MTPSRCALALLMLSGSAAPAHTSAASTLPVHISPSDDPVLSTMLLIGAGLTQPVLLFDPRDQTVLSRFTAGYSRNTRCMHRSGTPAELSALMQEATDGPCTEVDDLVALARALWPQARTAIAVLARDYEWLLRAAAFAGATGSALLPIEPGAALPPEILAAWPIETLYLTPRTSHLRSTATAVVSTIVQVATPDELTAEWLRRRGEEPPTTVVVANPRDRLGLFSPSSLSLLAPLVSAAHRAPLVLTSSSDPATVEREVLAFIDANRLRPTHIILVGDELALRSHRVPDPVLAAGGPEAIGGGTEVRVEIFSRIDRERPQDFAVGRIVAEDAAQASAAIARRLHKPRAPGKPVIFLSNADEIFTLGETISRTTASELRNVGVPVRTYFRSQVTPAVIRSAIDQAGLLVWEGHARDLTLEERGGIITDSAPAVVVLQGCYTLDRSDPFILMERGTDAIVATSAAIYSASGSAFARAFFDALLYEDVDLGTAVRNARNYLLALTKLKRLRGHSEWRKTYRAALAFALWGDPTLRPALPIGRPARRPAHWQLGDAELTLTIPKRRLPPAAVGHYRSQPVPRAMLGGLLLREGGDPQRRLKELFFTVQEVPADLASPCTSIRGWDLVSLYAPRTQALTLLARPDWKRLGNPRERGAFAFPLSPDPARCPTAAAGAPDP